MQTLFDILEKSPELRFNHDGEETSASRHICLLDIVFEMRDSNGRGLIKSGYAARSDDAIKAYMKALGNFLDRGKSLAKHSWFRAGLPTHADGKRQDRLTKRTLDAFFRALPKEAGDGDATKKVVDGLLYEVRGVAGDRIEAPKHEIAIRTPDTIVDQLQKQADDYVVPTTQGDLDLNDLWKDFCQLVFEDNKLVSLAGFPAHGVIGLPFGYRDPRQPEHFNLVAMLFLVVDKVLTATDKLETALRTIALYLYRTSAPLIAHQAALRTAGDAWAHEIKHLAPALKNNWLKPLSEMFDVEGMTRSSRAPALGRVELTGDAAKIADQIKISWYGRPLAAAGDFLLFSASLDDEIFDGVDDDAPAIVPHAMSLAFLSLMPKTYAGKDLDARKLNSDYLLDLAVSAYERNLYGQLEVGGELDIKSTQLPWQGESVEGGARHGLFVGVLAAMFRNVIQHGDVLRPIRVSLKRDGDYATLTVQNGVRKSLGTRQMKAAWVEIAEQTKPVHDEEFEEFLRQLTGVEIGVKAAGSAENREDTKSDDVVRFYLRDLSPSVTRYKMKDAYYGTSVQFRWCQTGRN